MSLTNQIKYLPKELQWQILLYTRHPVAEAIKKDDSFMDIIKLQRGFYDYIQDNMLFFEETELMDNTNTYFNPDMCKMLFKIYLSDMTTHERYKTIAKKRMIKNRAQKNYHNYDDNYSVKRKWIRVNNSGRLIRC